MRSTYELLTRDQAGALALLDDLGALDEIRQAVVGHYTDWQHAQPDVDARKAYKPQALKARLAPRGWRPEIRVPPFSPAHDALPINERYDAFKIFHYRGHQVGVAVEMEDWQIANDLLKFRRGFERGQIAAGVIIQPSPETLIYCY